MNMRFEKKRKTISFIIDKKEMNSMLNAASEEIRGLPQKLTSWEASIYLGKEMSVEKFARGAQEESTPKLRKTKRHNHLG